jgi:hypothetical protein
VTSVEEAAAAEAVYARMSDRFQTIREIELPYVAAMTDVHRVWWERGSLPQQTDGPSADDDRSRQFL